MPLIVRFLFAPLLLIAGLSAVHAQEISGDGATFADGPERSEVEAASVFIYVNSPCSLSIAIGVDREGKVVSAEVDHSVSTCADTAVQAQAVSAVRGRLFNAVKDAPAVQRGTVQWKFYPPAVDQPAEFPGGTGRMKAYLKEALRYPEAERKADIQGKVYIQFVVEGTGKLTDVRVKRGISPGLDNEALRLVQAMPDWIPGRSNGNPVRVLHTIEVPFRLN